MRFGTITSRLLIISRNYHHCVAQNRLKGKIAAVTASTSGIGLATAKRLAEEGAEVIISSRKQHKVDATVAKLKSEKLNVTGLVCEVSNEEDRKRLFEKAEEFGGLDILISTAGINPQQYPILQYEEVVWNKIFNINVTASFLLAKEAYPLIKKRGGGSIILMSSLVAYNPIPFNIGAYTIAKAAVLGMTKVLAAELGKDEIRVNCIVPGIIETPFGKFLTDQSRFKDYVMDRSSLKRYGKPEDVAGVIAFLVSDDAHFITGENMVIGGGMPSKI